MFTLFYLWVQLCEQMWVHKFNDFEVNMQRKYKKKNDSEIKIRLPENLKNDFYECCDLLDVPVAEVIRVLLSDFMKENQSFLLTKGSLPVDGKSAKRIVKRKERESSDVLLSTIEDIIDPLDYFDENLNDYETVEVKQDDNITSVKNTSTLAVQRTWGSGLIKPSGNRAQRRAMDSNKRKKNKKKR